MRRLVWLSIALAVVWCGWWALAAQSLRSGAQTWLQDRRDESWQAEATGAEVTGFPLHLALSLEAPALADPDTGVAFRAKALSLRSPAWWPGHVDVTLPDAAFSIATPFEMFDVETQDGLAALRLRPGTALELEHAGVTSNAWQIISKTGPVWGANGLALTLQQSPDDRYAYAFNAVAPDFQPGSTIRAALRIPQTWPVTFDSLSANGEILLDRPIDRSAIETARPQPRRVNLQLAEAEWGAMLLRASADLTVSEQGLVSGQMTLQARNWQDMLDVAETSGVLPAPLRPQIENILAALARGSGNPNALDVAFDAQDGNLFLGFIPLGSLPPLILR